MPDLLRTSANGVGDTAQWGYDSLALGFLCTRDGVPQYTIRTVDDNGNPTKGYIDWRHYYFGSSMPVVTAMLQSNGIQSANQFTGSRSAAYSYSEAIYNHFGRGFQGFRTITTEDLPSDPSRRLITQTLFNQKFPLVGKIDTIATRTTPGYGSRTIHTDQDTFFVR